MKDLVEEKIIHRGHDSVGSFDLLVLQGAHLSSDEHDMPTYPDNKMRIR